MGKFGVIKRLNRKNARQMAELLDTHEVDEGHANSYFQRLNLSGHDTKGQVSSAYGSTGIEGSGSVGVDFGAVLVPFVHFTLQAKIKLEGAAHALLAIHRTPTSIWMDDIPVPPQPKSVPEPNDGSLKEKSAFLHAPDWHTDKPLALGYLTGATGSGSAALNASAWAGLGSPFDFDETGLSLGATAGGEISGTYTVLSDTSSQHFGPDPKSSGLVRAVDEILKVNIKNKAALWLIVNGNGIKEARGLGAPLQSYSTMVKRYAERLPKTITAVLETYDETTIPDLASSAFAKNATTTSKKLASLAKKTFNSATGNGLKTVDLIKDLTEAKRQYELDKESLSGFFFNSELKKIEEQIRNQKEIAIAEARMLEATELIRILEQRQKNKDGSRKKRSNTCSLTIGTVTGKLLGKIGAKANFAADSILDIDAPLVQAAVQANIEGYKKKNCITFQSFSDGADAASGRTLITSQDTVATYSAYVGEVKGKVRGPKIRERGEPVKWQSWTTMSYRSVLANWFDDIKPNNHKALPNGSGVSFGMSIISDRLADYVRACKPPEGSKVPPAEIPKELHKTEEAMMKQLRVTKEQLRKFIRHLPSSLERSIREGDSYLVESAFAFTSLEPLTITDHKAHGMFRLATVKHLTDKGGPNANSRLQSIRLRCRIRDDKERRRHPLAFGISPEFFADPPDPNKPTVDNNRNIDLLDAAENREKKLTERILGVKFKGPTEDDLALKTLPITFGAGLELVQRVGSEGIVDLEILYFPNPYPSVDRKTSEFLQVRYHKDLTELVVPGVTLFSQ